MRCSLISCLFEYYLSRWNHVSCFLFSPRLSHLPNNTQLVDVRHKLGATEQELCILRAAKVTFEEAANSTCGEARAKTSQLQAILERQGQDMQELESTNAGERTWFVSRLDIVNCTYKQGKVALMTLVSEQLSSMYRNQVQVVQYYDIQYEEKSWWTLYVNASIARRYAWIISQVFDMNWMTKCYIHHRGIMWHWH